MWRQDEQAGLSFALKLTAAGARAIAIHDSSASDARREGTDPGVQVTPTGSLVVEATADVPGAAPSLSAPRGGTKLARVLELLQRDCGATLEELIAATDWLPHTTRAALTGLRKRGYAVTIGRHDRGEDRCTARGRTRPSVLTKQGPKAATLRRQYPLPQNPPRSDFPCLQGNFLKSGRYPWSSHEYTRGLIILRANSL